MRSIERRFKQAYLEDENLSTFICLGRAIAGQKFCRERISRCFTTLVDKNDYSQSDRDVLISHLHYLSSAPEAYRIRLFFRF